MGQASPPLKKYIDSLPDKHIRILIPGCGNAYEAAYLLRQGFTDVTLIDIAPMLVKSLKETYIDNQNLNISCTDFFTFTGQFDLVLEQTFFCAITPDLRESYVLKMYDLLKPGGRLAGVLFDTCFENAGPPFGGSREEYEKLFEKKFNIHIMEACYNSYSKRQGTELFFEVVKTISA